MRALTVFKDTTPTYVFNIEDAELSGISLDEVAIGMSLSWEEYIAHILPQSALIFDAVDGTVSDITTKVFKSDRYCRRVESTNSFMVTIPLWKMPTTLTGDASFQVYLFSKASYGTTITPDDDDGDEEGGVRSGTQTAVYDVKVIVIDSGRLTIVDSVMPPLLNDSAKRSAINVKLE